MPTAKTPSTQRVTIRISKQVLEKFDEILGLLHLRRDAYLNEILPNEIDELEQLPANSEAAEHLLRAHRTVTKETARIAVTLQSSVVERLNAVCKEKRVIRDAFFETLFSFLASGIEDEADVFRCVASPLWKAHAYLSEPGRDVDGNYNLYSGLHILTLEEIFK